MAMSHPILCFVLASIYFITTEDFDLEAPVDILERVLFIVLLRGDSPESRNGLKRADRADGKGFFVF